jgi:hypothetical protein
LFGYRSGAAQSALLLRQQGFDTARPDGKVLFQMMHGSTVARVRQARDQKASHLGFTWPSMMQIGPVL